MESPKTILPEDTNDRVAELEAHMRRIERRYRDDNRRLRTQSCVAWCALAGSLFLSHSNPAAIAAAGTVTLNSLAARVTILESQTANLKTAFAILQKQPGPQGPAGPQGIRGAQGPAGTPADMTRVAALEAKTRFLSANATLKTTTFTGCNVFVQNGLGATNGKPGNPAAPGVVNGLGNLIVGYDDLRGGNIDVRTGSHNLILGDQNNYSSFGGLIAGSFNAISGPYATISSGVLNTATGRWATVSGGRNNNAMGQFSSVSGGEFNETHGDYSSISGGRENLALGPGTSVTGGEQNTAANPGATVSGGISIVEQNEFGWAAGSLHSP